MKNITQQIWLQEKPDAVWQIVGDVGRVADWVPAIESSSMAGDIRHATFVGGGDAREQIVSRDDEARTYTYRYLDGPLPLKVYESTITVHPQEKGSLVVWTAQFEAEDAKSEQGLVEAIDGIYAAGLEKLNSQFEGVSHAGSEGKLP